MVNCLHKKMAAAPERQSLSSCPNQYYIGVDVGSGSARAGLFTTEGKLVVHCKKDIKLWKNGNYSEQSSNDIWRAVVAAVKVFMQLQWHASLLQECNDEIVIIIYCIIFTCLFNDLYRPVPGYCAFPFIWLTIFTVRTQGLCAIFLCFVDDLYRTQCVCSDVNNTNCIAGIGFDATCSLVALDTTGSPVTVSPTKEKQRNVIFWQDHRAIEEADEINAKHHPVLRFVGGKISPEMQPPKLLWLKRHLREECWTKAAHFLDLSDYLTYRATGSTSRCVTMETGGGCWHEGEMHNYIEG